MKRERITLRPWKRSKADLLERVRAANEQSRWICRFRGFGEEREGGLKA